MKMVTAALALGTAIFCAAPAAAVTANDTFVYAITGDIDSLDPHWQYDAISQEIGWHVYEGLILFKGGATDDFLPGLSTVVPSRENGLISADGLRYAFPLRKGVKFHDGAPMTAEDVRYSFLRFLLTDRAGGPSFLLQEPLLGTTSLLGKDGKPDPKWFDEAQKAVQLEAGDLVLRLKKPFAPLLPILAGFCPIVSKPFVAAHGGWDGKSESWVSRWNPAKEDSALHALANGTGPFKVERWDRENKQITLSRHEAYWRRPADLKRLVFKTVNEFSTRKLMLQAGDADAVMMERQYLPQVAGLEGVSVIDDLPLLETHNVFILNQAVNAVGNPWLGSGKLDEEGIPPDFFKDENVRWGFRDAFDYEGYIAGGYRGKARRATGPIPYGMFGYTERLGHAHSSLSDAEAHLRKAWGGKLWENGFKLSCAFMEGRSDRQLACQILKARLESLNAKFHLDVRPVLWSTMLASFGDRKMPLINGRWAADYADPHSLMFAFMHSEGYYAKGSGYSNPRADRLVEQAAGELDRAKRKALYFELESLAASDSPHIPTVDTFFFQVLRSCVKGWTYNPIMTYGYLYPVRKS